MHPVATGINKSVVVSNLLTIDMVLQIYGPECESVYVFIIVFITIAEKM